MILHYAVVKLLAHNLPIDVLIDLILYIIMTLLARLRDRQIFHKDSALILR